MKYKFETDYASCGKMALWRENMEMIIEVIEATYEFADADTQAKMDAILKEMKGDLEAADKAEKRHESLKPVKQYCIPCNAYTIHKPDDERGLLCFHCEGLAGGWWEEDYAHDISKLKREKEAFTNSGVYNE